MNKLIKGAAFAVCAGTMLVFTGCGGGNTPEAVAKAAIETELKGLGMTPDCKVGKSEISGDKGVVYIDSYVNGEKDEAASAAVKVIKIDGQWKVDPKK